MTSFSNMNMRPNEAGCPVSVKYSRLFLFGHDQNDLLPKIPHVYSACFTPIPTALGYLGRTNKNCRFHLDLHQNVNNSPRFLTDLATRWTTNHGNIASTQKGARVPVRVSTTPARCAPVLCRAAFQVVARQPAAPPAYGPVDLSDLTGINQLARKTQISPLAEPSFWRLD